MKSRTIAMLVAAVALTPGTARAQTETIQKQVEKTLQQARMYEDIEIMRRLLQRKLTAAAQSCQACHGNPWAEGGEGMAGGGSAFGVGDLGGGGGAGFGSGIPGMPGMGMGMGGMGPMPGGHPGHALRDVVVEGVHVPGYGVVFQAQVPSRLLNLPNTPPATKPVAPPSDWDLVRRQLRGERVEAVPAHKHPHDFNLDFAQLLLEVLAENGKHFRALGDNEKLTIALTFRTPGGDAAPSGMIGPGPGMVGPMGSGVGAPPGGGGAAGGGAPPGGAGVPMIGGAGGAGEEGGASAPMGGGNPLAPGAGLGGAGRGGSAPLRNTSKDHELLGDLHLKQARYEDAAKALLKAIALNTEVQRISGLQRKLAIAYLMQDQYQRADPDAVAKAFEAFKKAVEGKKEAALVQPLTLPQRLIVSVPQHARHGVVSPSEFRRLATVEWLRFNRSPTGATP